MRQKNKTADRTQESNDSPEIPDRGKTSNILSLPSKLKNKKPIIQHRANPNVTKQTYCTCLALWLATALRTVSTAHVDPGGGEPLWKLYNHVAQSQNNVHHFQILSLFIHPILAINSTMHRKKGPSGAWIHSDDTGNQSSHVALPYSLKVRRRPATTQISQCEGWGLF